MRIDGRYTFGSVHTDQSGDTYGRDNDGKGHYWWFRFELDEWSELVQENCGAGWAEVRWAFDCDTQKHYLWERGFPATRTAKALHALFRRLPWSVRQHLTF